MVHHTTALAIAHAQSVHDKKNIVGKTTHFVFRAWNADTRTYEYLLFQPESEVSEAGEVYELFGGTQKSVRHTMSLKDILFRELGGNIQGLSEIFKAPEFKEVDRRDVPVTEGKDKYLSASTYVVEMSRDALYALKETPSKPGSAYQGNISLSSQGRIVEGFRNGSIQMADEHQTNAMKYALGSAVSLVKPYKPGWRYNFGLWRN